MELLLLDDHTQSGSRILDVLRQSGYKVSIANDMSSALSILNKKNISIILIRWEVFQPEDDGFTEWLRDAGKRDQRYILFLVRDEKVKFTNVFKVGGDDLLVYPIDEDELMARLVIAERVLRLEANLRQATNRLDQHVMIDELTGLMNRRALYRFSGQELARTRRSGQPLSLLAIEIDNFSAAYSNGLGNKVLTHIAALLRNSVRPYDQLARWAGAEFLVILPDTDSAQATIVGERVLEAIEKQALQGDDDNLVEVKINIGLHTWKPGRGRVLEFDKLVREAERAMRRAPQDGSAHPGKNANRISA